MSIKKKYKVNDLHCPDCANVIIENLEKINYIDEVYIDYDKKEITLVGQKALSKEQVDKVIADIITDNHISHGGEKSLHHLHNIVTEEFNFEDIDCPNCASKVERALNKDADIIDARVNFINKKIIIKHLNNVEIYEVVSKIVSKVESGAKVFKEHKEEHHDDCHSDHHCDSHVCCCGHDHYHHKNKKVYKILLTIGIVLFAIAASFSLTLEVLKVENEILEIVIFAIYAVSYFLISWDILWGSFRSICHGDFFNENLLMTIASFGSMCIKEPFEATMVILLYKIGMHLQEKATNKSKESIKELLELRDNYVTLSNGEKKLVEDVAVGEIITVKVGERIPLDGTVMGEGTDVDMKALTGESKPIYIDSGSEILSGSINLTKVVQIEVTKESNESTIAKMAKLVEEASNQKSKTEQFITKFARVYTPIVLLVALVVAIVKVILREPAVDIFNAVFSILVISCPCALVISIPLGYFAGIGKLSSFGILVKGGNYLEIINQAKTFVFDKTGTITKGNFKVVEVCPIDGVSKEELLNQIAEVEKYSNHPIANSILEYCNNNIKEDDIISIEEISGKGLKLTKDLNGKIVDILVGNENLLSMHNITIEKEKSVGTIVYLAVDNKYLGKVVIQDEIKETSKELISELNKKANTVILTGDTNDVATLVASQVGIKEVKSQLLPKQKFDCLKEIISRDDGKVCYIGDGINDAPSLRLADVGIAIGCDGSDAARENADIVIASDDLMKVKDTIRVSSFTKRIIVQNIVMSLGIKVFSMVVGILGILGSYAMLLAVFADVGVCLLAILNTLRIMKFK